MTNASASIDSDGKLVISADNAAHGIAVANSTSAYTVIQGETRNFSHFFGLNDLIVQESSSSDYNAFLSSQVSSSTTAPASQATPLLRETLRTFGDDRLHDCQSRYDRDKHQR